MLEHVVDGRNLLPAEPRLLMCCIGVQHVYIVPGRIVCCIYMQRIFSIYFADSCNTWDMACRMGSAAGSMLLSPPLVPN